MARPRSAHVAEVKNALIARLRGRFRLPGDRFLSARAIASQFPVSYQTAHRLLVELEEEGFLRRKPSKGTFVPGESEALERVQFIFHPRSLRPDSFGARLFDEVAAVCSDRGIEWIRSGGEQGLRLMPGHFPIIWEMPEAVRMVVEERRFALLLNQSPPLGLGGACIDALSCDDRSGGAWAAQYLRHVCGPEARLVFLGGPESDPRNRRRAEGFLHEESGADLIHSGGWYFENGLAHASRVTSLQPDGVFGANDRLAEAVLHHYREEGRPSPRVVGFDDAPVAAALDLTTVGLPWRTLAETAADVAEDRLAGQRRPARHVVLPHRVVVRASA